jgi:hypothetical protein
MPNLAETLALDAPVLANYDWGGRAACAVAALRPAGSGGIVLRRLLCPGHCDVLRAGAASR